MAFAGKAANTYIVIGNTAPTLVKLAEGDDSLYAMSCELVGGAAIDNDAYLGSEAVEAVPNQYSMQANVALAYGDGPKALPALQDREDNVIVVMFTDVMTHYTGLVSWTGQPYENPTDSQITIAMEFLQNGAWLDGGPVAGDKNRAVKFTDLQATETGIASFLPTDVVYLVVDKHEGTAKDFTMNDSGGAAITQAQSVAGEGIFKLTLLSGKSYGDLVQADYDGDASNKISGYLVAGPEMKVD